MTIDQAQTTRHWLYHTRVMHKRLYPAPYRFEYPVYSLLLDLDALDDLPNKMRGQWAGIRFDPANYGPRDGQPLRPWADALLAKQGIDLAGGRIRLLCFPSVLGYTFNPLTLWYCDHADGSPRAVIAEVSNTFGDQHFYVLADEEHPGAPMQWPIRAGARKAFYVSPLMDMQGGYRFRIGEPGAQLAVLIRQHDDDGRLKLVATQTGWGEPLTDAALSRARRRAPLMTAKVIAAIHWQALKIWLKGTPFVPKPDLHNPEMPEQGSGR